MQTFSTDAYFWGVSAFIASDTPSSPGLLQPHTPGLLLK